MSLASFDATILQALEETETALSRYQENLQRRDLLRASRDQAEAAARITRARQREGDISSLELVEAERTAAEAEAALAEADAQIATSQIDLSERSAGAGRYEIRTKTPLHIRSVVAVAIWRTSRSDPPGGILQPARF